MRGAGSQARGIRLGLDGQALGSTVVVKGHVISINWHVPMVLRLAKGHPKGRRQKREPREPPLAWCVHTVLSVLCFSSLWRRKGRWRSLAGLPSPPPHPSPRPPPTATPPPPPPTDPPPPT